jgi:integrase
VLLERPKDGFDRVVLTERLVEAGLTLIGEADADIDGLRLRRALLVRNGLMVALLALCPIRLKNFAPLEIGRSFLKIEGAWWIVLEDTKSGRPDHRPVPSYLTGFIERYLDGYRPVLLRPSTSGQEARLEFCNGSTRAESALWIGRFGAPLSYSQGERAITETTLFH